MKKSIKLALRASELRTEINRLEPVETNAEARRTKLGELETVEAEFRVAHRRLRKPRSAARRPLTA